MVKRRKRKDFKKTAIPMVEALDTAQELFIEKKVRRLGSVEAVRLNYRRDDAVSRYAVAHAEKIFN